MVILLTVTALEITSAGRSWPRRLSFNTSYIIPDLRNIGGRVRADLLQCQIGRRGG